MMAVSHPVFPLESKVSILLELNEIKTRQYYIAIIFIYDYFHSLSKIFYLLPDLTDYGMF